MLRAQEKKRADTLEIFFAEGKTAPPPRPPSLLQAPQLELFGPAVADPERWPRKPYCTEDPRDGVRIRPRSTALKYPYVQANPPHLRMWMLFDIDREGGGLAWEDAGLPVPAWAAINKENGHAHLSYGLTAPVLTGDGSRDAPLRYLCAIDAAYRAMLRADPGYSGLITKNPFHPLWRVLQGTTHMYDLGELSEYVELDKHTLKSGTKVEEVGLGRNCTLFDWLRLWSYVAVRRHRETRNFILWQAECYDAALQRNYDFKSPLDPSEAFHVAKSVAKWTWSKDREARAKFVERQKWRGAKGGKASGAVRLAASEDKRATARLMRATGMTQAAIAQEMGVHVNSVANWLKT
jgi:hypothetical protein